MSGTMPQYVRTFQVNVAGELYDRLSEKPTKIVQKYYNFLKNKIGLIDILSPIPLKKEKAMLTAKKVLEERSE